MGRSVIGNILDFESRDREGICRFDPDRPCQIIRISRSNNWIVHNPAKVKIWVRVPCEGPMYA